MQIPVARHLLQSQDYGAVVRAACDALSAQGIGNYLHHWPEPQVELTQDRAFYKPIIDQEAGCVRLRFLFTQEAT